MAAPLLLQSLLLATCSPTTDSWQEPATDAASQQTTTTSKLVELSALKLTLVASGLANATFMCGDPVNADRWFVLQKEGRLRVIEGGVTRTLDFLDLSDKVSTESERGLLGMAFHPQFPETPWVYLNYTDKQGSTNVARFTVNTKTWVANPASEKTLLVIEQPWANHNGGMIAFGPKDGYLYIGMGDGGAAADPHNAAQNGQNLLGKILRIDVDQGEPYGIPASNPFVGNDDFRDEIWAYGVRNPWRFCFDPLNGDLYIGDVGQNKWEEISWQPGSSTGGENYGWRILEGNHAFDENPPQPLPQMVAPIHEYGQGGKIGHCSVTGGYLYRGAAIPGLEGVYFYGDFCSGAVGSFRVVDGQQVGRVNHSENFNRDKRLAGLVSFAVDAMGEMYILTMSGSMYKIEAAADE
jgi:glucose/arabinose dehydrogenase